MFASLNGIVLLEGRISVPRCGAWHADLSIDGTSVPTGTLSLVVGSQTFSCTALARPATYAGTSYLRVVGGKGGLPKQVPAQQFVGTDGKTIVSQTLSAVGESLSSTSSLGMGVDSWNRAAGQASTALSKFANAAGLSWRVLVDGTVWVGSETWPNAGLNPSSYIQSDNFPSEAFIEIALEDPTLLPGTLFLNRRVSMVVHDVGSDGSRTKVWFEGDS